MSESKHTETQITAVRDALAETLGDAYDCTRVWAAWSCGTMGPDDFRLVADDDSRLHELTIAALDASGIAEMVEALKILRDSVPMQSAYQALIHAALTKAGVEV